MRKNKLATLQRETIERLESELEYTKRENELFRSYNDKLEEKIESMRRSYRDAMTEYESAMEEIKELKTKASDVIKDAMATNKENERQFKALMNNIKKDTKNINTLCSVCNKEIADNYAFVNGCYFCIDCWDHKAD